jgi:CDP-diacylglycerol--serine O-phosphatidyltransferase
MERRPGVTDTGSAPLRPRSAVAFLPTAATLANLICGFMAMLCALLFVRDETADVHAAAARTPASAPAEVAAASADPTGSPAAPPRRMWRMRPIRVMLEELVPTWIVAGLYLLLIAMLFDAVDGRLARWVRRTSVFGAELDSLADVVSFGVAPALLLMALLMRPAEAALFETRWEWQAGLSAVLIYACCAAGRLARFNAEHSSGGSGHDAFRGLPSPGAAVVMVSLLLLYEDLTARGIWSGPAGAWRGAAIWTLVGAAVVTGAMMISRVRFPHVVNMYIGRRSPARPLILLLAILAALAILHLPGTLALGSLLYLFSARPARRVAPKPGASGAHSSSTGSGR